MEDRRNQVTKRHRALNKAPKREEEYKELLSSHCESHAEVNDDCVQQGSQGGQGHFSQGFGIEVSTHAVHVVGLLSQEDRAFSLK